MERPGSNGSCPGCRLEGGPAAGAATGLAAVLIFTIVVDVLGNALVILSVLRNKKLRNAGFGFQDNPSLEQDLNTVFSFWQLAQGTGPDDPRVCFDVAVLMLRVFINPLVSMSEKQSSSSVLLKRRIIYALSMSAIPNFPHPFSASTMSCEDFFLPRKVGPDDPWGHLPAWYSVIL
ncbi:hypothetical protein BTVI_83253 [Pitangus sulphuratus]|nr:hypothetical protein BTVI_83253 [Pitangus sulphuratus]